MTHWPDWTVSLFTRCPGWAHELGFVRELIGIRRRHAHWRDAWQDHLDNTRGVILRAAGRCARHRKAVIVGTGWLNDVPVAELAATFREVVLVDVVHPLGVRGAVRKWRNVSLLAADVTGTLEGVVAAATRPPSPQRPPLPRARPELFCDDADVDLVASVNVLSQLPCMPEGYLLRHRSHTVEEVVPYARDVILAHLDWLRRCPGVAALVGDTEVITVDAAGREVGRSSTVWGLDLGLEGERWTWYLLPRSEQPPHHGYLRAVVGALDLKTAASAATIAPR